MKKVLLTISVIGVILNTIIGIISSEYQQVNILLVDFSIFISASMIYCLFESKIADGFKIGLTIFFSITGFVRIILAFLTRLEFKDNVLLILFIAIIAIEYTSYSLSKYLSNK